MGVYDKRDRILKQHPCFSKDAHFKNYRLHLPVAPKCNLGCNFCERSVGNNLYRPGATERVLSPNEALELVKRCIDKNPNLSTVGIAGPGDPLANEETFETIRLIKEFDSNIDVCLSTNGVLLADSMERLLGLGIGSISISLNSLKLKTIERLYSQVIEEEGIAITGKISAEYILQKQQEALISLSASGIIFKVNTILFEGINEEEIGEIAEHISSYGAELHNIVPYIPVGKLSAYVPRTPDKMLQEARICSHKYVKQFVHCKQCPADAYDIPGKVV